MQTKGLSSLIVRTHSRPVIDALLCRSVNELAQCRDGVRAHQRVASERPAVHHPNVQRRMKKLILRQILNNKCERYQVFVIQSTLFTKDTSVRTHHFKPLHQSAEIRILLVVLNQRWLNAFPRTLDVHTRTIHLCQIHSLQVPQTPEQHLRCIYSHRSVNAHHWSDTTKGFRLISKCMYVTVIINQQIITQIFTH